MKKIITLTLVLLFGVSLLNAGGNITIKGSDTLVRLGQRWAEEYMKLNPGVVVQVSGGGTGTGIAALINGSTDICQASRDMKEKEYKQAEVRGIKPYRVAVSLDGISIFLNEKNPVKELTFAQLKGIYTGAITNWKEVGGNDARIIVYGRENNSGTYAFFKEHVLDEEDYSDYTQTLPGTAAVVNAVAKDVNGIGYGGIAWATGVRYAAIKKTDQDQAVLPSMETVSNGTYPISRELFWFFSGQPQGELKKLVNWALSEEGQKVAESVDYIPLPRELAEKNKIK
ncbi:MAG: phosphate ABC transporter substrate-binding protein [candidate division Zixibacteria bacterium]|nr:phosphate ABC transporter substrate-binding protein [candidate division Zixibacteria bacterium]MDD5425637.1 phosphate ABC transporter substrate-binding protein [candidate division Zixibacteria bacterium]